MGQWFVLAVTRWSRSTSYSTPGPVNTWMGDLLSVGRFIISVCNQPPRSTKLSIPPGWVNQVPAFQAGHVHLCRVACNTVWSHMASDNRLHQDWERLRLRQTMTLTLPSLSSEVYMNFNSDFNSVFLYTFKHNLKTHFYRLSFKS